MDSQTAQSTLPDTVSLKASDDGKQVLAIIPAGENVSALNAVELQKMLQAEGYGEWHTLEDAIAQVCGLIGQSDEALEVVIAECLDAEFSITVSDDALQVFLTITPPQGGRSVDTAMVQQALSEKGIRHGIIQAALETEAGEKVLIAQGEAAIDGEDTRFENLIPEVQDKRPKINDDGTVDYHEIGAFVTVSAGDALMRKHPPTKGTNGCDVYGKVIMAKAGKELPFTHKLSGAEVDAEDRNLLRASIGGQPEIVDHGMNVNPVMSVKNVDLSTGNINFDGTVNIQGDIAEGLKVHATGDILVAGMVEGAVLQADGNIVISKGVIGRGEIRTEEGGAGVGTAQLKSGGSIEARFIENAIVEAANNITVGELVSHSELTAFNCIVVGKKGAKKGHILGGTTKSTISVQAQVIGSQANVHTFIEVGSDPKLHDEIRNHERELAEKEGEYNKLTTLIGRLRSLSDEKSKQTLARVFATLKKTGEESKQLKKHLATLKARYQLTDKANVKVGKHAFPNVEITIGNCTTTVRERTEAGEYTLSDKNVVFDYS